jgi:hypothetical protein
VEFASRKRVTMSIRLIAIQLATIVLLAASCVRRAQVEVPVVRRDAYSYYCQSVDFCVVAAVDLRALKQAKQEIGCPNCPHVQTGSLYRVFLATKKK